MDPLERFVRRLRAVEKLALKASTTPQLASSSIEDGALTSINPDGSLGVIVGKQYDGTQTIAVVNGPPPPQTSVPIVTPRIEGATIRWDGEFVDGAVAPMNFGRVEAYASSDPSFPALEASQLIGFFESPRGGEFFTSLIPGTHYIKFVTRSQSGVRSAVSTAASVIPTPISSVDLPSVAVEPPSSSPEITHVEGNATGLTVVTDPVDAATLLDYYIDGVLVAANQRTSILNITTTDLAGTAMALGTDYTVTVWAQNGAGAAPAPSMPRTARLNPGVTSEQVSAIIRAGFILAGAIQVGTSMTLDPTGGFTITHPDGRQTYFRADGSGNQMVGQAILDALVVLGNLNIQGLTNFLNGLLTMGTGVSDPTSKPGVTTGYDSSVMDLHDWTEFGIADPGANFRGLFWTGTQWRIASSVPYFYEVNEFDPVTGARNFFGIHAMPGGFRPLGGAVAIGGTNFVLGKDDNRGGDWYVYVFNSSWVKTAEWAPIAAPGESLCIGVDGASLLIAKRTGINTLYVSTYTTAGVESTAVNCGTWSGANLTGVAKAPVDTATARYVVASTTAIRVFNTSSGARVSGEEWPAASTPIYGLGHDGSNWFSTDGEKIWEYTNLIGTGDFAFAWLDDQVGQTGYPTLAETKASDLRTIPPTKRAKWTISLPSAPDFDGTLDGANTARLYYAPTGGTLVLQATLAPGVLSQTFSTLATSGPPPPSTNGFAGRPGALGRFVSGAPDSFGDPLTDLDGEGYVRMQKFAQSGQRSVPVPTVDVIVDTPITFDEPFDTVPRIKTEPAATDPSVVFSGHKSVTATGFTLTVKRTATTGTTLVDWSATTAGA